MNTFYETFRCACSLFSLLHAHSSQLFAHIARRNLQKFVYILLAKAYINIKAHELALSFTIALHSVKEPTEKDPKKKILA